MANRKSTYALICAALAAAVAPDPEVLPSVWAAENLVVPDGPYAGEKWSPDRTPYVVPILDALATSSPHNIVVVRKAAQVGLTTVGIAWLGSVIDKTPGYAMTVFPTLDGVRRDFNRSKLTPAIMATPALREKVHGHKSRSATASTAMEKIFPGGILILTGANSSADLSSKSIQYLYLDEINRFPRDVDKQGSPLQQARARQMSFRATGNYKRLETSTPTELNDGAINDGFLAGDQSYLHVPCPHCGEKQRLVFGGKDEPFGLKFAKEYPHNAYYLCRYNGCIIEHHHKRAMVAAGEFVAENPGPGRYPSFHIDTLISSLVTWDDIAQEFLNAKDKPLDLRTFVNLWLAEPFTVKGDAPEWERLFALREEFPARAIPPGGVILTGAADVQQNGIYYEIVAWGFDRQSWSIDVGYLEGRTDDPDNSVWRELGELYDRHYPNAAGMEIPVDRFMVDAGFNTAAVHEWCKRRGKAMAIAGRPGPDKMPIASAATDVDINVRGKRIKRRAGKLWFVGTWGLKAQLYEQLAKKGLKEGEDADPAGYVHLSDRVHDDLYLKQLTAERHETRIRNGEQVDEWKAYGPNHWHDCRIYNMAAAHHLRVGLMGEKEWAAWANPRGGSVIPKQQDMLPVMNGEPQNLEAARRADKQSSLRPRKKKRGGDGFFDARSSDGFFRKG